MSGCGTCRFFISYKLIPFYTSKIFEMSESWAQVANGHLYQPCTHIHVGVVKGNSGFGGHLKEMGITLQIFIEFQSNVQEK